MELPEIVTGEEWERSHEALLAKEKQATRARDELAAERRRQPMVEISADVRVRGPRGHRQARRPVRGPQPAPALPLLAPAGRRLRVAAARCSRTRSASSPISTRATRRSPSSRPLRRRRSRPFGSAWAGRCRGTRWSAMPSSASAGPPSTSSSTSTCGKSDRVFLTYSTTRPRRRGARERLDLPRPDAVRAPGGVGGHAGRAAADAALHLVAHARRVRVAVIVAGRAQPPASRSSIRSKKPDHPDPARSY